MGRWLKLLTVIALCASWSMPASGQVWPYFPPPGMSYNYLTGQFAVGTLTNGVINTLYGINGAGTIPDANSWGIYTDNLSIPSNVTHFSLAPDSLVFDSNHFDDFMAVWHGVPSQVDVCQQGVAIAAQIPCRITLGTNTAAYQGNLAASGMQIIIGPLNQPALGGSYDEGFRVRCFDNDSCGLLARNHRNGTQAYEWTQLASGGGPPTLVGMTMEVVPSGATSAATSQRIPHLTGAAAASATLYLNGTTAHITAGALTIGQTVSVPGASPTAYLVMSGSGATFTLSQSCSTGCGSIGSPIVSSVYNPLSPGYYGTIISPGNYIEQISDGNAYSDIGGNLVGTTARTIAKTPGVNEARQVIGDNANPTSSVNIVSPSAANAQVNGNPMVGAIGALTTGDCLSTSNGTTDTLADAGNPCLILTTVSAVTNVATLSGVQTITIPGGSTQSTILGTSVLLTGQTSGSQNGPYLIPSGGGAWINLGALFQTGNVIPQYTTIVARDVQTGATYALNTSGGPITVGTTAQSWAPTNTVFATTVQPLPVMSGSATPLTVSGGTSLATSGNAPGGAGTFKGGDGDPNTAGNSNGAAGSVQGGKGGSTTGSGNGGQASCIGGAGSTTTTGSSNGGDCVIRPGAVGSGTGSNGTARIQDSTSVNWIITNTTVGSNLPPKTSNGGITCNAGAAGSFMSVSDATTPSIGSTYTNGGSSHALIECNGSSWIIVSGSPTKFPPHLAYAGSAPAVSACGTGPSIDAHATDASGTVTVGTVAAASCTVTFNVAFTTWNHCRVTSQSTIASFAYSYTLSAITVTGTSLVSDLFDYDCDGL